MAKIEYQVLGPMEVTSRRRPIGITGRAQRLILGVLLVHAGRRVSTDRLIDGIWGDEPGDGALHALRVHISNLRKLLEPDHVRGQPWAVIETVEDGYRLRVDDAALDRDRFERRYEAGRRLLETGDWAGAASMLREALAQWQGTPFGELAEEHALRAEATRLEELRLQCTEDRVEADLCLGRHGEVIAEVRDLVELYRFRERPRGLLMLALYRAGRQTEALRAYRSLASALGEELGIEPSHEIKELEKRILMQDPALRLVSAPPSPRTNLPVATSSFIGRELEMAQVDDLAEDERLLTFLGPGGVGKTRLALAAAGSRINDFSDGVWLVALAPLRDPTLVAQTVAEVLEIDQQPDRPVEATLVDRLRESSLLLILDNCEHLIDAAATVADSLLHGCPKLRVWATSREPLRLAGEMQLAVSGLRTPASSSVPFLSDYESVRLFVDRASAVRGGFELDAENAAAVAQICRQLDGIPLAIELAAARSAMLSPQQIAAGLDDRFELLTTGNRTADPRQQTLEATLDWSYRLLTRSEQGMLRRLSVFRGTFGLDAVEAVVPHSGADSMATLDVLAQLVAKSLVMSVPSAGEMRYQLLETVRLHSQARLTAADEQEDALVRHRDWYMSFAEIAGPGLRGADQLVWLQRLEDEHDNLRAVLERSHSNGDIETSLRIAGAIAWFWFLHSHLAEGWLWLERLIGESGGAPEILKLRVLIAVGQFAWEQSKDEQARAWLQEAASSARRIGSRTHTGWALGYLALLSTLEGRWADGRRLAAESLRLFEAAGNLGGAGFSMWIEAAATYLQARDSGTLDSAETGGMIDRIGGILDMARQVGERNFIGHLQWSLAIADCDRGDLAGAAEHLSGAIEAFDELGNKACAGHTLDQVALLALAQSKPSRAARLLAATEALRSDLGIAGHVFERRIWDRCRQRVADVLDSHEYEDAWRDGAGMSLDQAIGYALSNLSEIAR